MIVSRPFMGTVFRIEVPDGTPDSVIGAAFAWWTHVEETFSTFIPESDISRIGRGELADADASREVRHVLARCAEIEEASGGRFSIRPGRPDGPGLDPAGLVKGWSVDEAAMILLGHGLSDFSIDAGGDVLCVGRPPDGERWRVGIRHPEHPETAVAAMVEIDSGAVATSGTYFRGEHIRGKAARALASVTIVGPQLGTADALATAVFADQAQALGWLGAFPGYGVVVITSDGKLRMTADLEGRVVVGTTRPRSGGDVVRSRPSEGG
ncbi:MAG TPA: FAD:protein FMN transferase [Acidimicrobiia bacterium]|nr:FAD:protein FMN transferase [Acidimicrobiia bacterium]